LLVRFFGLLRCFFRHCVCHLKMQGRRS
jgi:hypothetical protein